MTAGAAKVFTSEENPRVAKSGRRGGTRTPSPRFWRPVLYQLSYTPSSDHFAATRAAMQEQRIGRDPNTRSSPRYASRCRTASARIAKALPRPIRGAAASILRRRGRGSPARVERHRGSAHLPEVLRRLEPGGSRQSNTGRACEHRVMLAFAIRVREHPGYHDAMRLAAFRRFRGDDTSWLGASRCSTGVALLSRGPLSP